MTHWKKNEHNRINTNLCVSVVQGIFLWLSLQKAKDKGGWTLSCTQSFIYN